MKCRQAYVMLKKWKPHLQYFGTIRGLFGFVDNWTFDKIWVTQQNKSERIVRTVPSSLVKCHQHLVRGSFSSYTKRAHKRFHLIIFICILQFVRVHQRLMPKEIRLTKQCQLYIIKKNSTYIHTIKSKKMQAYDLSLF